MGFRVWGLGVLVQGLGVVVWGLGYGKRDCIKGLRTSKFNLDSMQFHREMVMSGIMEKEKKFETTI